MARHFGEVGPCIRGGRRSSRGSCAPRLGWEAARWAGRRRSSGGGCDPNRRHYTPLAGLLAGGSLRRLARGRMAAHSGHGAQPSRPVQAAKSLQLVPRRTSGLSCGRGGQSCERVARAGFRCTSLLLRGPDWPGCLAETRPALASRQCRIGKSCLKARDAGAKCRLRAAGTIHPWAKDEARQRLPAGVELGELLGREYRRAIDHCALKPRRYRNVVSRGRM
mmetsp:Transcript_9710/g.37778  ORF Transcript_9710/g.37778 Transcript_9710/m.37778 type:complete len:221 (+) Transcript_9710:963-1625(+)